MTEHDDDRAPRAVCALDHLHWLGFERNYIGEWVCACDRCSDADCDADGYYRTDPVGRGDTPAAALDAYCESVGVEAKELLVLEPHV